MQSINALDESESKTKTILLSCLFDSDVNIEKLGKSVWSHFVTSGTRSLTAKFKISHNGVYRINIIVSDSHGLSTVYNPKFIVLGQLYDEFPGVNPAIPISIGAILILM